MKKLLLPLFLVPMMFGAFGKNNVKTELNFVKTPSISYAIRLNDEHPFLDYWTDFRKAHDQVCEITQEEFKEMYIVYMGLTQEEKEYINAQPDGFEEGYTIGQVIRTLVNKYYPNHNKVREEKQKLDQSSIIIIATVVALVGATAISVLYILKNEKVIK